MLPTCTTYRFILDIAQKHKDKDMNRVSQTSAFENHTAYWIGGSKISGCVLNETWATFTPYDVQSRRNEKNWTAFTTKATARINRIPLHTKHQKVRKNTHTPHSHINIILVLIEIIFVNRSLDQQKYRVINYETKFSTIMGMMMDEKSGITRNHRERKIKPRQKGTTVLLENPWG